MRTSAFSYKKGFTFIELLVAISIIGVLATIILSGGAATRKSARVVQRVSDMKRVQSALDLYYSNNRSYPSTGGTASWRSVCSSWGGYTSDMVIIDINNGNKLVPTYLSTMPSDPQTTTGSNENCYLYTSNGTDYAFLDHQVTELATGNSGATYAKYTELLDPHRDGGSNPAVLEGTNVWAWKVSSPGAIAW